MTISDELGKLGELHQRGVLSDGEFAQAKAKVLGHSATSAAGPAMAVVNALRRSRSDRWLGGVCGGLGEVTGAAAWIWRLVFTALVFCGGTGVVVYVLLWIFVPDSEVPLPTGSGKPA